MNKTIPTNIAKFLFYLEEDAYQKLEAYLTTLRAYFVSDPDSAEIISDIENRIAEQFIGFTGGAENKQNRIIVIDNVDHVIKTMGSANEFDLPGENTEKEKVVSKRLYRDHDNAVIGGVASGIASYFGIDQLIIRLIFGISILFGGTGLLVYIIFWLAVPEAKNSVQKLEMRGEPITVESVKGIFKEKVDEVKAHGDGRGRFIHRLLNAIRTIFNFIGTKLLPIFGKIVGVLLNIFAILAMLALTTAFIIAFVNGSSLIDYSSKQILGNGVFYLFTLLTTFFLVAIPVLFISALGTLLMGKRPSVAGRLGGILLALWLLALVSGAVLAFNIHDRYNSMTLTEPEYQEATRTINTQEFSKIKASKALSVSVEKGEVYSVELSGRNRDLDTIKLSSADGLLSLSREYQRRKICIFCWPNDVNIKITAPSLEELTASEATRITISGFDGRRLSLLATNASRITFYGNYSDIIASAKNASKVQLKGISENFNAKAESASSVDSRELAVKKAIVEAISASRISVNASDSISGRAERSSHVTQFGNADTSNIRTESASTADEEFNF